MEHGTFLVSWGIELNACSPEEAVRLAVDWLSPKDPTRWCYSVINYQSGEPMSLEGEDLFADEPENGGNTNEYAAANE